MAQVFSWIPEPIGALTDFASSSCVVACIGVRRHDALSGPLQILGF